MTFTLQGTSREILSKKIEATKEIFLNEANEKSKFNGWQWYCEQTTEQIVKNAQKNRSGLYQATLYFIQKPLFEYNYHGLPNISKSR